ncbi:MAG: cupin domain-containing protein [Pseudomonadota bacterium]
MSLLTQWRDDPLGSILGPDHASHFLGDLFERDFCLSKGLSADRFDGLITIADVDRIVTSTDLKEGDLALAQAGKPPIDASSYVDDGGYIDRGAVARHYRDGATIILNQAQRIVPALGELCRGLEHVFSSHIQTNLYLTPPGKQGFQIHFDNHDVFVIQVQGAKDWRLYGTPLDLPFRGESFHSGEHETGDLREEFVLNAGDCVYVPRGMMHDASTAGDTASLHITVGLISKTWADLVLESAAEVALRIPAFRQSLPPGFARDGFDRTAAQAVLAGLGKQLGEALMLDPAMDLLTDQFIRSRAAINRTTITDANRAIAASDRFTRAPLAPYRFAQDGDALCLVVPGGDLHFTDESRDALHRALGGTPFTMADLAFEHAEALTRRLFDYGLVERV